MRSGDRILSSPDPREPDPPSPSFHPRGFVPDRRDAEATVMRTAIKLEKERRKLREEREIFQKRQWDLDARELGLKQREARCAEAIELYQIREDRRGEHISASNAALLRESEDARRDLEGLKNAAIEAEERARRAEARLRMIEEDATRKRDELESLRAKARARAANDARRIEQEPEWERASLALNRETKLRELLAETFGVVGDVNRALEHGFARCGALAEGCWRASGRWRTRRRRRRASWRNARGSSSSARRRSRAQGGEREVRGGVVGAAQGVPAG